MTTKDKMSDKKATSAGPDLPESAGRRALLKGAAISMPAVLTMHSGAALARSSNLISASEYASTDRYGRTLCLEEDSVYPADGSGYLYDMGDPASGRVAAITERDYKLYPKRRAEDVSEARMCKEGGTYYYRTDSYSWDSDDDGQYSRRWQEVTVKKGMLVSATALTSFASDIDLYNI